MESALKKALNAANWTKHIRGKVFIKPNLCSKYYIRGAVTNPYVLFHLVSLLRDRAEEVVVGESNGYNYCCNDALAITGVKKIVEKAGGTTINLSEDKTVLVQNPNTYVLQNFPLPKTLIEADSVVDVPVMKTHEFTKYSGAIKNLFGCIPNNRRIFLHPKFDMVMHDLLVLLKPKFVVMDATYAMEGNGPNRGIVIPLNLVLTSSDLVVMDKVCCEIMDINWVDINHIKFIDQHLKREKSEVQIIGEKIEDMKRKFLLPYDDLAVRTQRWVYKNYFLTRLCFGTPFLNMLQGCLNVYRKVDSGIKGKEWVDKHWDNSLPR
ncbi:hypothetical protein AC477_02355 [miscellaneous Crenarchaeota group-1 archaeon SG8-32-1]|uniref:DUF362 domain-containing protein n=1 Tax=miscellaneous Crenarchaeota group-1 archaeon SG8-32-1 TaxID=1685124 RepID=A0A0M0BXH3_9ARCH|nr:MAG: hypothetical protein AC477_02355 [miscellaneous Crenarchaeota group-1 archaeon SG8-32-1]